MTSVMYTKFMKQLQYDYSFMMADYVGGHGATVQEVDEVGSKLEAIAKKLQEQKPSFTKLPHDTETVKIVEELAKKTQEQFENLIVVGIGGSDLGARAVISALKSPYYNFEANRGGMRVFFLGGNTDPQEIAYVLAMVDLKKTAINVISKSGDTIEPMSAFLLLRDLLIKEVGHENHAKHVIATTDSSKGTMREIVNQNGYQSLAVPDDVGGRFSVLSTVGLFPIACAGVDIGRLLAGARGMDEEINRANTVILNGAKRSEESPNASVQPMGSFASPRSTQDDSETQGRTLNIAQIYAALHYFGMTKRDQKIHVVMPYAEHLRQFGFWYRQLWAESLGKKENLAGATVFRGSTPIAALGSTDQHSQMQLYNEGPFDKLITFIRVEKFDENYEVPHPLEDLEGVTYMAGHDFAKIINTEAQAAAIALAQNGRPNGTLIIFKLDEETLGELFMFYEWVTAYMAELLEVNAYNQPGVQAGKDAMYALLGRRGFEERKKELEKHLSGKKYII